VSPERVDVSSATTKRAKSYLRWYPSKWRERYGEEFIAHLEIELIERPVSFARTADIVAHGILTRLSFGHGLRLAMRAASAVVLIVAATLGAIALSHYWAPVTISSGYDGGTTGVGEFGSPSQVEDMSFNFSTHNHVAIRITSVKVIPVRGFQAPEVVGVAFAPHASELGNDRGWPIRLPKGTTVQAEGKAPIVQAFGTTVTLARTNALWLGMRAPSLGHAYAVEEVRVTYQRRGISHSMTINQSAAPDVICSSSSRSGQIPSWCSQQIQAASAMARFSTTKHTAAKLPSDEATMVAQFAVSDVQAKGGGTGHGVPTLVDVRRWAGQLFSAASADAIQSVTGVNNAGVPKWRFVITKPSSHSSVVLCTNRGLVDASGGEIGVGIESCPPQKQG